MSTTTKEGSALKKYEIMAIIQNDRSSAEAKTFSQETILGQLKEHGANITFQDFWGDRGFAYTINGMKWGYYFVAQFEADPAVIKTVTREWNITKGMVRFLISLVDKKAPDPISYEDMKKTWVDKKQEAEIEAIETSAAATPPKDSVDKALDAVVDSATKSL